MRDGYGLASAIERLIAIEHGKFRRGHDSTYHYCPCPSTGLGGIYGSALKLAVLRTGLAKASFGRRSTGTPRWSLGVALSILGAHLRIA
jgi:hypothetical protein